MITKEQKSRIQHQLDAHCARYSSQNKAANALKGVSVAVISDIRNGKWDRISDDMWRKLESQLVASGEWKVYGTTAYNQMMCYLDSCKNDGLVMWVVAPAGTGKSTAAMAFRNENRNVFVLTCSEDMNKTSFVRELAAVIGVKADCLPVRETLAAIVKELVRMDHPVLIFDEADKLTDRVLYFYVSLYNALEGKCGMMLLSTHSIRRRMEQGILKQKKGYDELDSRIGRQFVPLKAVTTDEVAEICRANGLQKQEAISKVTKEAAEVSNDLRRVKRSVYKELQQLVLF
ncbi:MAG: ATP-binding protein [Bacteroidales bacterium]|nr:ATP-binding protein [Bacteroidales bacterium]